MARRGRGRASGRSGPPVLANPALYPPKSLDIFCRPFTVSDGEATQDQANTRATRLDLIDPRASRSQRTFASHRMVRCSLPALWLFRQSRCDPVSGCAKALRELQRAGHQVMPAGQDRNALRHRKRRTPRGLGTPVAAPLDVPEQAGEVRALQLIKVDTAQDLRLRNTLMCEHPQGAGVMVGAQLRYLIGSEHGWLGGLGVRCVGHHAGIATFGSAGM